MTFQFVKPIGDGREKETEREGREGSRYLCAFRTLRKSFSTLLECESIAVPLGTPSRYLYQTCLSLACVASLTLMLKWSRSDQSQGLHYSRIIELEGLPLFS